MSDRSHLEEISIKALGVIEETTLELSPGFTVLTGETGAGKTMILTALSLVLGGKSDASLVRQGKERLVASASFSLTPQLIEQIGEIGADAEEGSLILTRTVNSQGKSKSSAGGVNVPVGVLAEIGEQLIEVHAQAASMSITKPLKQREILDRYAGEKVKEALSIYAQTFSEFHERKKRIAQLRASVANRDSEVARLKEFAEAFTKLKPVLNEYSSLLNEISRLSSVEDIREGASLVQTLLSDDEAGALTSLGHARRSLEAIASRDPALAAISENVSEAFFLISDSAQVISSYLIDLEADPIRLDFIQNRRADFNAFLKRYASADEPDEQIAALISRFENVKASIADLTGGDERLATLEKELQLCFERMQTESKDLSRVRQDAANTLSSEVSAEIHTLSMPHTQFLCTVISPDYSESLPVNIFTASGCDEISMTIQGHQDGPHVAIAKGASGGELSRVMLALEVVLAQSQPVGTYIFDEVDAGVGGKAAIEVGRRLHELSTHAQVIVVTHLAQVAAWADSHFVVTKSVDGTVSQSGVSEVSGDARVAEIARMLAGLEESRSAQEHATELLALRG
ncbi:MAG: DNA repair protein RecN [Actinomycetes bacterium]